MLVHEKEVSLTISIFDLYTIGIGPSSSHSVGPMRAAAHFVSQLQQANQLARVQRLEVRLYGSLALTGVGHGTDKAVLMGLLGHLPETVDPASIDEQTAQIVETRVLPLAQELLKVTDPGTTLPISFDYKKDLLFLRRRTLPEHPNGMEFLAWEADSEEPLLQETYFSVGGGFILTHAQATAGGFGRDDSQLPYRFSRSVELLELCKQHGLSISELMLANEKVWFDESDIRQRLLEIWRVMQECVHNGCHTEGILPGGLKVKRRAASLYRSLSLRPEHSMRDPLCVLDWVDLYALAVNEENAAGGRVVTAPTNGAAGIIPAVLHYYDRFVPTSSEEGVIRFLLTAGAIATLYKKNASISGAEVGCQGEVGVACSMAAGALTEVLGGSPDQVEQAAEIGMEHNLGLTCDPIGGLVQVPCIERNAMGAVKAINAARLALRGDGTHHVTLDKVIATMRRTGKDMSAKYKETSRGGLAVNLPEC